MDEVAAWTPNDTFGEAARWFAGYRETEKFRLDEVDYKESVSAIARRLLSPQALETDGIASRLAAFLDGKLDLSHFDLTPDEKALIDRWPYRQSMFNLLGGGPAMVQIGPYAEWARAATDDDVRGALGDLLYGHDELAARVDRFAATLNDAYRRLFDDGKLWTKTLPTFTPALVALLPAMTAPERFGLYRAGTYATAAHAFGYPLRLVGSPGSRYAAATRFLADVRAALTSAGCQTETLVDAHNFLWVWVDSNGEQWLAADFDALRTDRPQVREDVLAVAAKMRRLGDQVREGLRRETGLDLSGVQFGYRRPNQTVCHYITESSSETRFGSRQTQRPQLNVEVQANGIHVFFLFDQQPENPETTHVKAAVAGRLRQPESMRVPPAPDGYSEMVDEDDRYMVRTLVAKDEAMRWPNLGADELSAELGKLVPLYKEVTRARLEAPREDVPVDPAPDPIFADLERALELTGQVILYGPPGTGKTWTANRFAQWWARKRTGGQLDPAPTAGPRERRTWWVVANPQEWRWDKLFEAGEWQYRYGRLKSNYPDVRPGDLVVGYQANPDKRIVALATIKEGLHETPDGQKITLQALRRVKNGPTYNDLLADPVLSQSEPMRFRNQGTLFRLTTNEADLVLSQLQERDESIAELEAADTDVDVPQITRLTFHASYAYEDFVEGHRPVPSTNGLLNLELKPGSFKRVCDAARAHARRDYLVLIDEINRANLPKVFGELITVLERDKRGTEVTLQNGGQFSVPPNVYIVGTMNTADRSIRLLDAAFRRRFAFIELMPDSSSLRGACVGPLALDGFLDTLNRRIRSRLGREKQIGQSYLLLGGEPIDSEAEFARRFRLEILPLLQEYSYDDYGQLRHFLGDDVVDEEAQRLRPELSPAELVTGLARGIQQAVEPRRVEG